MTKIRGFSTIYRGGGTGGARGARGAAAPPNILRPLWVTGRFSGVRGLENREGGSSGRVGPPNILDLAPALSGQHGKNSGAEPIF